MTPLYSELARVVEAERARQRIIALRRHDARGQRSGRRASHSIDAFVRLLRRTRRRGVPVDAPCSPYSLER